WPRQTRPGTPIGMSDAPTLRGTLFVVGPGPGAPGLLTPDAAAALEEAEVVGYRAWHSVGSYWTLALSPLVRGRESRPPAADPVMAPLGPLRTTRGGSGRARSARGPRRGSRRTSAWPWHTRPTPPPASPPHAGAPPATSPPRPAPAAPASPARS